jgi:hypothetical protein
MIIQWKRDHGSLSNRAGTWVSIVPVWASPLLIAASLSSPEWSRHPLLSRKEAEPIFFHRCQQGKSRGTVKATSAAVKRRWFSLENF